MPLYLSLTLTLPLTSGKGGDQLLVEFSDESTEPSTKPPTESYQSARRFRAIRNETISQQQSEIRIPLVSWRLAMEHGIKESVNDGVRSTRESSLAPDPDPNPLAMFRSSPLILTLGPDADLDPAPVLEGPQLIVEYSVDMFMRTKRSLMENGSTRNVLVIQLQSHMSRRRGRLPAPVRHV